MSTIAGVSAWEMLDSRGNPTVEVEVRLSNGATGRSLAPSGASTGSHEMVELRDGDSSRFGGRGVLTAIASVEHEIGPAVSGLQAEDQASVDTRLIELDGTPDLSRLGGNAIVAVSLATAHAAAADAGLPLYRHLSQGRDISLPVPMFNVLNGGRHARDSTDVQEFMVVPAGVSTLSEAVRAGAEVYHALGEILETRGLNTNVGDEGGFAPSLDSNQDALDLLVAAIESAGYRPGEDCFLALDVAAQELRAKNGAYVLEREGRTLSSDELTALYSSWVDAYPIVSIEDGLGEDDWEGWTDLAEKLGDRVQLVGDDIFTTNPGRIVRGIESGAANSVLIKLNQIGTVTGSRDAIQTARVAGWTTVISHRSGETEDTTIADLAVGAASGQIKSGAPARGERTAKYNRLMRIERELGSDAVFAGLGPYAKRLGGTT